MEFQAVKGTRDFYPEEMALRNWLTDAWRRVSLRNGFVEFDGPEMEYLDLYRAKSGDEIVSQLFNFKDRGGRELALRPELTPTLARMVNAKINSLPRPIKWFSVPRLFRAENPQKGRLREFFQWNVDIIGSDDVLADAECIFTAVDLLGELGLTGSEVEVRIGSRPLAIAILRSIGINENDLTRMLALLDKRLKVSADAFREISLKEGLTGDQIGELEKYLEVPGTQVVQYLAGLRSRGGPFADAVDQLTSFWDYLDGFGILEFCRFDQRIVRGLAYYTGIVYEIFDAKAELRAIAGGGRYDNLLEVLGGPKVGATGFGMGDAVLAILLEQKGKLPNLAARLDCFVLAEGELPAGELLGAVARLRKAGIVADFTAKKQNVGKLLKEANRRGAAFAVIVRPVGKVSVKNLAKGTQVEVEAADFLSRPREFLQG